MIRDLILANFERTLCRFDETGFIFIAKKYLKHLYYSLKRGSFFCTNVFVVNFALIFNKIEELC